MPALGSAPARSAVTDEEEGETWGRFYDPDGNVFFLLEAAGGGPRRAGPEGLEYVSIMCRDVARTREFFTKALGMRARRAPGGSAQVYGLSPGGTAIWPFTPKRENYADPRIYEGAMAHLGEITAIAFTTRDLQDQLLEKGVRFRRKDGLAAWGGLHPGAAWGIQILNQGPPIPARAWAMELRNDS